jgi:hypothetical protein
MQGDFAESLGTDRLKRERNRRMDLGAPVRWQFAGNHCSSEFVPKAEFAAIRGEQSTSQQLGEDRRESARRHFRRLRNCNPR